MPMPMSTTAERLESLGFPLGAAPKPGGIYKPVVRAGPMIYVSGAVPIENGKLLYSGKVPGEVGLDEARMAARLCAANNLRMVYHALGSLDLVARVVRLTGFVNSEGHFTEQHLVINGASELLREVFGEAGIGARSAVGMAQLPLGATVETELILEAHATSL